MHNRRESSPLPTLFSHLQFPQKEQTTAYTPLLDLQSQHHNGASPTPQQPLPAEPQRESFIHKTLGTEARKLWTFFGATPILCCYVSILPICGKTADASTVWRDTPWFFFPVLISGAVWSLVLWVVETAESRARKKKASSPVISAIEQVADWFNLTEDWKLGIQAYGAASHLTCTAFLFLLLCQSHPDARQGTSKRKLNGLLAASEIETYSEHMFTLALLAACRLAAASLGAKNDALMVASDHCVAEECSAETKKEPRRSIVLACIDYALSIASFFIFVFMCGTLSTVYTTRFGDSCVDASKSHQWMQWVLFNLLAYSYFLQGGWVLYSSSALDALARTLILTIGCAAFYAHAGKSESVDRRVHFYALRAWGADSDATPARVALQVWAALLAARWFVVLSACVTHRLRVHLKLDVRGKHAADVDDISFSLGAICLFAASYASSPLHQLSSNGFHSFSLLTVLGSDHDLIFMDVMSKADTKFAGLAGVSGAATLHWIVGMFKATPVAAWLFRRQWLQGHIHDSRGFH